MEYLINGVVDVFYYPDNGKHYFVRTASDNWYELKNEQKEYMINGTQFIGTSNEYIGVLTNIFIESPSISKKVKNVHLTHKSLIKITREYHIEVCSNEDCIVYEKQANKIKHSFGLLVGINGMSISNSGKISMHANMSDSDLYLNNSNFDIEVFPSIGFYYKVNRLFSNERLYFQYIGTYSQVNLEASSSHIRPYSYTYLNDFSVTLNSLNNMFVIKYESTKGQIRLTFQFGTFVDFLFQSNNNRELNILLTASGNSHYKDQRTTPFNKFDVGISCGVGLKSFYINDKEFFLDLKYKRGFGLAEGLNTNTLSLNLGLQIAG